MIPQSQDLVHMADSEKENPFNSGVDGQHHDSEISDA